MDSKKTVSILRSIDLMMKLNSLSSRLSSLSDNTARSIELEKIDDNTLIEYHKRLSSNLDLKALLR